MLGLALATSNAPSMYRPAKDWQAIFESQMTEAVPPPNELAEETDEIIGQYIARIHTGFDALHAKLKGYGPDVLVVLGYDDGTCFSGVQVPQLCTYTGAEIVGTTAIAALGEKPEEQMVRLRCAPEFAWDLHASLVDRGFDMSYMSVQNPLGKPENGISSAFTRPVPVLLRGLEVPIVPIFINSHVEPTPPGHRCYAFGRALGEILEESPSKVGLLGVGGLSHDPRGDRAGWIDDRLDKWVLSRLEKGDTQRLRTMFDLDSDTLRGGTGQVRTWIATGAAAEIKQGKATVVDYIPALRAITGIAFAYWELS